MCYLILLTLAMIYWQGLYFLVDVHKQKTQGLVVVTTESFGL